MVIKRFFEADDSKSLDELFNDLLKCNIDIIIKNTYDSDKVNIATTAYERKEI
ncbi:hypothetical protein [Niallia circulans]|uniref:hypothetical protein n=1 Tax=Niallia circulans TaxID=1397 RepID=UPI0013DE2D4B|nr:hypothetical protein [Niallia circulans]